eukprot:CAMPEP_0170480054 /NCGR_PEP_ID=MMETSP0208-20121228/1040_1 /TAXON_ID=197538 /ORGANISM="Strombidium inclinatum, Strain S3" /LENGTH=169 /DNA_ID=CAMNT_0010752535 /DNA_START=1970 /DNA_END=2476 /DNA_ORIENTATION=-
MGALVDAAVLSKPEVCELNLNGFRALGLSLVNEKVFWFDVAMHKAVLMHVVDRVESLEHYGFDGGLRDLLVAALTVLHLLVEVLFGVLEHDVDFPVLFVVNHLFDFDDEGVVIELLERLDFERVDAGLPVGELALHLLDGYWLLRLQVNALDHHPEGSLAKLLNELVFF